MRAAVRLRGVQALTLLTDRRLEWDVARYSRDVESILLPAANRMRVQPIDFDHSRRLIGRRWPPLVNSSPDETPRSRLELRPEPEPLSEALAEAAHEQVGHREHGRGERDKGRHRGEGDDQEPDHGESRCEREDDHSRQQERSGDPFDPIHHGSPRQSQFGCRDQGRGPVDALWLCASIARRWWQRCTSRVATPVIAPTGVRVERVALEDHRDVAILRLASVDDLVPDLEHALCDVLEAGDQRKAVDFPEPEGPTRIMNSPSAISRFMSLTASKPTGYRLVMCSKLMPATPLILRVDSRTATAFTDCL